MRLHTERVVVELVQIEHLESELELYDRLCELGIPEYDAKDVLEMRIVDVHP